MSLENKENEMPVEMVLQRSFEAMWYQSEVLHKRSLDLLKEKFEANDKRLEVLEQWNEKINETIRDRIMMFSQDIIATLKEMMGNIQSTLITHSYRRPAHFAPRHILATSDSVVDPDLPDEEEEQDPPPAHPCLLEEDLVEEEDSDFVPAP